MSLIKCFQGGKDRLDTHQEGSLAKSKESLKMEENAIWGRSTRQKGKASDVGSNKSETLNQDTDYGQSVSQWR